MEQLIFEFEISESNARGIPQELASIGDVPLDAFALPLEGVRTSVDSLKRDIAELYSGGGPTPTVEIRIRDTKILKSFEADATLITNNVTSEFNAKYSQ